MPGANSPNSWSFPQSHRSNPCSLSIPRGTNPLISESDGQFTQVVYDDSIQVGFHSPSTLLTVPVQTPTLRHLCRIRHNCCRLGRRFTLTHPSRADCMLFISYISA